MRDPQQALARAWQHQQAGELPRAEALCAQLVRNHPRHAPAWALLGVLACQAGKAEQALDYFGKAVSAAPAVAAYRNNRGAVLQGLGRNAEAEQDFRAALRLDPKQAEVHFNLGTVLRNLGRVAEAEPCCRRALERRPDYVEAHGLLGTLLQQLGRLNEAAASYQRTLDLRPNDVEGLINLGALLVSQGRRAEAVPLLQRVRDLVPGAADAHQNLGNVLRDLDRNEEAAASYRRALELNPNDAGLHNNLGVVLWRLLRPDEAMLSYRRALELKPDAQETHHNLGAVLRGEGRHDEALACYQRALELQPDDAQTLHNLANVFRDLGQTEESTATYRRALTLSPGNAEAHCSLGQVLLLRGEFEEGWSEYEWRFRQLPQMARPEPPPRWHGEALDGRAILLYAEQGLGDSLQFVRYAPLVRQRAGLVLLECPVELVRILGTCAGIDRVVRSGSSLPPFDVQLPLLSLPRVLQTTLATIPSAVPYLAADPAETQRWQQELGRYPGFKIGIVWQGNPRFSQPGCRIADQRRSLPLAQLEPLTRLPHVRLFSLQKGYGTEQLAERRGQEALAERWGIVELGDRLHDWVDTAAVMMNLDLIISADTSPAHLAGALGRPVWVAVPFAGCWRWLVEREDTPWYPTMRLFRQRRPGDWGEVFARMARELTLLLPPPHCSGERGQG